MLITRGAPTRSHARARTRERAAPRSERSMESGIIANVDRLKESREEEILYLTYVTSDHGGISCLRPRPEEGEREPCLSPRRGRAGSPFSLLRPPRHPRTSPFALTLSRSCSARHCPWKSLHGTRPRKRELNKHSLVIVIIIEPTNKGIFVTSRTYYALHK